MRTSVMLKGFLISQLVFAAAGVVSCDSATSPEPTTLDDNTSPPDDSVASDSSQDIAVEDVSGKDTTPSDTAIPDETNSDAGDTTLPLPKSCDVDADCDDTLACTVDQCVLEEGSRHCKWTVAAEWCFIGGKCYADGAAAGFDPCRVCDATVAQQWSLAQDETACSDGNECTVNDMCSNGVCVTEPRVCDDNKQCTMDQCDPLSGCIYTTMPFGACDDGNLCTHNDRCADDVCAGTAIECLGQDPCVEAACNPTTGECETTPLTGTSCEDDNPCLSGDLCQNGVCVAGAVDACNDGNECTIDTCNQDYGCYHIPNQSPCCIGAVSVCDDANPCTDDSCDPLTGQCSYGNNTSPCNDGKLCTENDVCDQGLCGGTPMACDDSNVCTLDSCSPSVGCLHEGLSGGVCDDGLECSIGDTCYSGECLGDNTACVCKPLFEDATKVTSALLGTGETDGEALDVNGDGTLDNAFGGLAGLANGPLDDAVVGGSVMLLAEFRSMTPTSVVMAVYNGSLAAGFEACGFQTETCSYEVDSAMVLADTCEPLVNLPGTLSGNLLSAGGPGTAMPFSIPLTETAILNITLYMVRFQGTLTIVDGNVTGMTGILAGAITETDLMAAIDALPPDALSGVGMTPAQLKMLLPALVPNDISTTGGAPNAKSIGLKLQAIDGIITGVKP